MELLADIWRRYVVHAVDIALVAMLFYQLLLLVRGTRAIQISIGILIVGLATVLSQFAGLPALGWLLEKFWFTGVVVIAVVLQPELRSALARLGTATAGRVGIQGDTAVINELVAAVKEASRRQMGFLVAIERDNGLRDYIETGTALSAEVSRELLLTIFQPPAVLHDGAVIIQGNRIAAAGCILPVSQDAALSKLLGTRHRAAVGISEVSDALAICVSEETGNVSLAVDGELKTGIDPDGLREMLVNFHRRGSPDEPAA